MTPGLLATQVSHILIVVLVLTPMRRYLLPDMRETPAAEDISYFKLSIYIILVILLTLVLTPLEVAGTRLAIQRNHSSAEYNSVQQEVDGDTEDVPEYSGADEDVIGYAINF